MKLGTVVLLRGRRKGGGLFMNVRLVEAEGHTVLRQNMGEVGYQSGSDAIRQSKVRKKRTLQLT